MLPEKELGAGAIAARQCSHGGEERLVGHRPILGSITAAPTRARVALRCGVVSDALASLWNWFAETQCQRYSPIYDRVCRYVATRSDVLAMVAEAPPSAHMPNVLLAAAHYVVLSGVDHPLRDVYSGVSTDDPGPLFADLCLRERATISQLLATRHVNTNEVGRSAVIGLALSHVAAELGAPLGLVDIGCSAGLNLLCDRYRLDYGPAGATGPVDAAVAVHCEVLGGRPPIADHLPPIVHRAGIDRDPVDLDDPDAVRWQLALSWPDTGRLQRTRAALDHARAARLEISAGDAIEQLPAAIAAVPLGCTAVVVTTWALAYLSVDDRDRFDRALAAVARHRPIAWVSAEGPGVVGALGSIQAPMDETGTEASILGLVSYEAAGSRATHLGFVHPHGRWVDWRNEPVVSPGGAAAG